MNSATAFPALGRRPAATTVTPTMMTPRGNAPVSGTMIDSGGGMDARLATAAGASDIERLDLFECVHEVLGGIVSWFPRLRHLALYDAGAESLFSRLASAVAHTPLLETLTVSMCTRRREDLDRLVAVTRLYKNLGRIHLLLHHVPAPLVGPSSSPWTEAKGMVQRLRRALGCAPTTAPPTPSSSAPALVASRTVASLRAPIELSVHLARTRDEFARLRLTPHHWRPSAE
jgi:hypothetical protein